jgi:hypothetical protein
MDVLKLGNLDSFFGIGMIAFSFAILAIAPADRFWIIVASMFVNGFMIPL